MKRFKVIAFLMASFFLLPSLSFAADLTALQIIEKVDNLDDGETSINEMTMILIDRNKNKRVRQIKGFRKDYGKDTKSVSFFMSPADVRNTGFLSYDWDDDLKEDDTWLYMPALRAVRRIAGGDKKDNFMGSDFTYNDMSGYKVSQWDYKILKESIMLDGQDCWVIGAIPKKAIRKKVIEETGYVKRYIWVRKDNFMAIQGKSYVKKGKKIKVHKASQIEKIQGIWTAKKVEMTTLNRKGRMEHATVLQFDNIVYNKGVDDNLFTTKRLEKGL